MVQKPSIIGTSDFCRKSVFGQKLFLGEGIFCDAHTIRYITTRYNTIRYNTTRHITFRHITIRHITTRYSNNSLQQQLTSVTIRYSNNSLQ
jgi:hypothetical protein